MKKLFLIALIAISLNSCDTVPQNVVYESDAMTIKSAEILIASKRGKYKYSVSDSFTMWILFTDKKYNVGDTIQIIKK